MLPSKAKLPSAKLAPLLLGLLAAWAVLSAAPRAIANGALPAPGEYTVDASGSTIGFSITEFLVNTVSGKFTSFSGHVAIGDSLATSQIQASVNVSSIDTGVRMRNEHLVGPDYFDVAHFPKMQFASTQIWGTPDNFGIKGNLTIKSVTKEVTFTARIQDDGSVLAEAKIDRTDFGITSGGTIKNEVRLRLQIRLARSGQGTGAGPR